MPNVIQDLGVGWIQGACAYMGLFDVFTPQALISEDTTLVVDTLLQTSKRI